MAEGTPLFMDIQAVYSGDEIGLPYRDIIGEGIVGANDLKVQAKGTPDLSVDILAGAAWITGDTNAASQPTYRVRNDATVNKGISPDPSNPRKVLVVAQITDETFAGTGRKFEILALHGTPAGSPTEPALPASAIPLALIDVTAADTDITNAQITDRRVRAGIGAGQVPLTTGSVLRKSTLKDVVNTITATDLLNGEITIAAGALGTDKAVRVTIIGDYLNNSGGGANLTPSVKLGATTLWAATIGGGAGIVASATRRPCFFEFTLANLGSASSQAVSGLFYLGDVAAAAAGLGPMGVDVATVAGTWGTPFHGTSAEDTTTAKALTVNVNHGTAHANISFRLKHALIEII